MKNTNAELTLLKKSRTVCPSAPDCSILEAFANSHPRRPYLIEFVCPEFTSVCPVTGQPDFGRIRIRYIPMRKCIESKSLKLYLLSFRNHGAFHEQVVNIVLDDITAAIAPRAAIVSGEFNARGGISINVNARWPNRIHPGYAGILLQ